MDLSRNDFRAEQEQPHKLPPLPQLWVGYLLGFANIVAEFAYASLHPELAKAEFQIPPLYYFLLIFVGWVYWLVCVYRFHVVMQAIPGWKHPISPARAVGFHFIPLYNLYWFFKWPQAIAGFVNAKFGQPIMKPKIIGLVFFAAYILRFLFDPGFGLIMLCLGASYISGWLNRAFALPPLPTPSAPPPVE